MNDYIDVTGAASVVEVADVVAAVLGGRAQVGGEPGTIVVTSAADHDLSLSIALVVEDSDRAAPALWARRILVRHRRADVRHHWTHHIYDSLVEHTNWGLTLVVQ
jgi:hypothetical protein